MSSTFVGEMIERGVLRFGDFTLKSGRKSPYFFNLGSIDDGAGLAMLGSAYADALMRVGAAVAGRDIRPRLQRHPDCGRDGGCTAARPWQVGRRRVQSQRGQDPRRRRQSRRTSAARSHHDRR